MMLIQFFHSILRRLRPEEISEDVYEWFSTLYFGELNESEFQQYLDWAEQNPNKAKQIEKLEATWKKIPAFQPEKRHEYPKFMSDLQGISFFYKGRILVTAVLFVMLFGSVLLFSSNHESETNTTLYETARGETTSINLADGSVIFLNVLSKIEVTYIEAERRVRILSGEAAFSVAKDPNRPFIVSSGFGQVRALGTEFNTKVQPNQNLAVTLIEGSIQVTKSQNGNAVEKLVLDKPGLQANITATQAASRHSTPPSIAVSDVDIDNIISWRQGKLIFSGETLDEAIETINTHTTHTIHLQASELSQSPVYGVFNSGDWEGFLSAVEQSYPLHHFSAGSDMTILSSL